MKLTEIKKLKVAELRSRLRAAGLDGRGLKAELVVRLWSAVDSGLCPTGEHTPVEVEPDAGEVPALSASPPAAEARPTAPCCPERSREFADSGTQTEPEAAVTAPRHGSGSVSEPERSNQAPEETGRGRAFYEFKEEIRYKRMKSPQRPVDREEAEEKDEDRVQLDLYDRHLHFEAAADGCWGQPRFWAQLPALWSGCRLSHGVLRGSVGFEVRLEKRARQEQPQEQPEEQPQEQPQEQPEEQEPCGVRVGWSVAHTSLLLGEDELSCAFDGRSKKVSGGKEEEFGESFSEGDIIGCYASFSTDGAVQLSFHKNGRFLGVAFSLGASVLRGRPLIPHVLCKSCSVRFLLDPRAPPWYPGPAGFTPLAALPAGQRLRSTPGPSSSAQSEVLLMMGFPGSGKSHWARTHMKQHPEKRYRLLGTEELLSCVDVGQSRSSSAQWDSRLRQAARCLTDLIKIAAQAPGNYILDQCNVLFSARRHKLQLFSGFRRRAVVVFPSDGEWKRRLSLQQMSEGSHIPETALLKLQVSCSLPEQQTDLLEELQYVELPQEQAQMLLQEYKDCARRRLPPIPRPEKKKPRVRRNRLHTHGPPPAHRIQNSGQSAWSEPRTDVQQRRVSVGQQWRPANLHEPNLRDVVDKTYS